MKKSSSWRVGERLCYFFLLDDVAEEDVDLGTLIVDPAMITLTSLMPFAFVRAVTVVPLVICWQRNVEGDAERDETSDAYANVRSFVGSERIDCFGCFRSPFI